ncbi:fimbrial protein [Enterobacter asburiae]|uniref:fimbrial protein n=1 Tax=Scandinavium sp. UTDF21-P1B TaxID=3446379 RepID=UPI00346DF625
MQMKKMWAPLLALSFLTGTAQAAPEDSGKITFTGAITASPCSIAPDSTDINVPMGVVTASVLKQGGQATPVPFNINLLDCQADSTVTVKFTGTADGTDGTLLGLQGGHAAGAGIALLSDNNTQIPLGEDSSDIQINSGNNSIRLQAALKGNSTEAAHVVTPGEFTSLATFTLAYN